MGMAQTGPYHAPQTSPIRMGASIGRQFQGNDLRTLQIDEYQFVLHSISPEIDEVIDSVYRDILFDRPEQWGEFTQVTSRFLANTPSSIEMDKFFEAAEPITFVLIEGRRAEAACDYWRNVLSVITNVERALGREYHKGSGYFFWACSWFRRGDTNTGLLIMHKALIEDNRRQGCASQNWPSSSSAMVISLDKSPSYHHPASWWVDEQVAAIDNALLSTNSNLNANEIRRRLFMCSDPETISLLVYSHSAIHRIESLNLDHHDNKLLSSLALGHLFRITVFIESLLRLKSGRNGMFKEQIQELSSKLNGQLHRSLGTAKTATYASDINNQQLADAGLLLKQLVNGTACYQDVGKTKVSDVDRPLCIAYVLRNIGAHEVDAPMVIAKNLHSLRVQVLSVLAKCVSEYFP